MEERNVLSSVLVEMTLELGACMVADGREWVKCQRDNEIHREGSKLDMREVKRFCFTVTEEREARALFMAKLSLFAFDHMEMNAEVSWTCICGLIEHAL